MREIDQLKNEIFSRFNNQDLIEMSKALGKFIQDHRVSSKEKADFYIKLSKRNPDYFMDNVFSMLQIVSKYRSLKEINITNYYIIIKYCLLKSEKILLSFEGTIDEQKTITTGRIYLTNYRMIACGNQVSRSVHTKIGHSEPETTRRSITVQRANIQEILKDRKDWHLYRWGFYFPIYNARNIKKDTKSIFYTIELEIKKKSNPIDIKITPLKQKGQSKEEFEGILDQIEQKLIEYQ